MSELGYFMLFMCFICGTFVLFGLYEDDVKKFDACYYSFLFGMCFTVFLISFLGGI